MRTDELAKQILAGEYEFAYGSHPYPKAGMCVMEAAAYAAGEAHSYAPRCIPPWARKILIEWNDHLPSDAARKIVLGDLLPKIIGTCTLERGERDYWFEAIEYAVKEVTALNLSLCDIGFDRGNYGYWCLDMLLRGNSNLQAFVMSATHKHHAQLLRIAKNAVLIMCNVEPSF